MDILGGDFAVDLTAKDIVSVIIDLIVSGRVKAIHGGLPCESFSPARRGKRTVSNPRGYPARVRSQCHLWGLPTANMTAGDKACLERGNSCLREFLKIARVCLEQSVTASVEQPARSLMWSVPELVRVKQTCSASVSAGGGLLQVWQGLQETDHGVVFWHLVYAFVISLYWTFLFSC